VHPQRNLGAGYISPQNIQSFVPGVELLVVGAFEACATQAKYLHVIAKHSLDEVPGDVRCVWNALRGNQLALQDRISLLREHCYATF
jgi:hypothetical protein